MHQFRSVRVNQVSVAEALLVQCFIGMAFAFDLLTCGRLAFTYLFVPIIVTQWSAFRMHRVGMTLWHNPFVVGIGSSIVSFLMHAVIQNPHAPELSLVSAGEVRSLLDRLIVSAMTGVMLAFIGFLLAFQCVVLSSALQKQSRD
ncbi:MAG: hypothetical protein AAFU85_14610 [Planctomycetota bacterium]